MSFFDWFSASGRKRRKVQRELLRCSNKERSILQQSIKVEVTDAWFIDHIYNGTMIVDYNLRFVEYKKHSVSFDNDLFDSVVSLISKDLLDYEEVENGFTFEVSKELKWVWSRKKIGYIVKILDIDASDLAVKCHKKKYGRIKYSMFPGYAHVTNLNTVDFRYDLLYPECLPP